MLKDAALALAEPLTYIINRSLRDSTVPGKLKIAKVLPLFKSGPKTLMDNYRPISILPAISKILERVVYDQLSGYLERNDLITSSQFGFRRRYNTELALTLFTDGIRLAMDQGKLTGAVFIDPQKACDTVEQSVLLSKLPFYGVTGNELMWIENYLSGRFQYVHYDDVKSELQLVKFGVPQESILGPLLLLIQINDLIKSVDGCTVQMYADDNVIYTSHRDIKVIENTLSANMTVIKNWLDKNRLIINLQKGKTESMLFGTAKRLCSHGDLKVSLQGHLINFTSKYKYRGMHLDPSLSMSGHLQMVLKKAMARINLLARMRKSMSMLAAKSVYSAHVLPTILYCSTPVLNISETMTQKFEKLREKAQKIIYYPANQNRENRFCNILNQKKLKAACLIFKCLQGKSIPAFSTYAEEISHNYKTRKNNASLRLPLLRTEAARKSFLFQGPRFYNELPLEIRSLNSFVLFRSRLKEY